MAPPKLNAPEGFAYDVSEWPIFVTIRLAQPTDEAYVAHLRCMDTLLARAERHVQVVDATEATGSRATQMRMLADWNNRNRPELEKHCIGVGMVLQSAIQRFGVATMLTLMKRPMPYAVFATRAETMAWARQLVAQPPSVVQSRVAVR